MKEDKEKIPLSVGKTLASKLLRRLFRQEITNVEYKNVSKSNSVFRVQTKDMGNLIVRLSHDLKRKDVFEKEEWCSQVARQHGIPTPRILACGNHLIPFSYSISEEAKGENGKNFIDKKSLWKELGNYGKRINSIDTKGFGVYFNWRSHHNIGFDSWKEYLFGYDIRLDRVLDIYKKYNILSKNQIERFEHHLERIKNWTVYPKLTHFDLVPTNVLVDSSGKITSILDWEYARSLPAPYGELSQVYFWLHEDKREKELAAFVEGYGYSKEEFNEMREEVESYMLMRQANHLSWLLSWNKDEGIKKFKMVASGLLH